MGRPGNNGSDEVGWREGGLAGAVTVGVYGDGDGVELGFGFEHGGRVCQEADVDLADLGGCWGLADAYAYADASSASTSVDVGVDVGVGGPHFFSSSSDGRGGCEGGEGGEGVGEGEKG